MKNEELWKHIKEVADTMTLDVHDGEFYFDELIEYLGMKHTTGKATIKKLLASGLISRRTGKHNRWVYFPLVKE